MSNDEELILDVNRAIEIIKERTAGKTCPFCDHQKWLIETKPAKTPFKQLLGVGDPSPVYLITEADSFWDGPPTILTAALSCENCGFIRLHNVTVLLGDSADGE